MDARQAQSTQAEGKKKEGDVGVGVSVASHNQYLTDGIPEETLLPSPIALFNKWFKEAEDSDDVPEPEAMTICTVSLPSQSQSSTEAAAAGAGAREASAASPPSSHTAFRSTSTSSAPRPSARVVLLKQVDASGFLFYSNYHSRKGLELAANPWISATFYWRAHHRSVRICGRAEKVEAQTSQRYFDSRPIGSRLGARASPQSQVIRDRAQLEALVRDQERQFGVPGAAGLEGEKYEGEDKKVPVPDYWGGYRIVPDEVEFWCGRNNRLHDRFR